MRPASRLMYAYQENPGGIAEALGLAARFAGSDPVVVMLADNVFEHSIEHAVDAFRTDPSGARVILTEMSDRRICRTWASPSSATTA